MRIYINYQFIGHQFVSLYEILKIHFIISYIVSYRPKYIPKVWVFKQFQSSSQVSQLPATKNAFEIVLHSQQEKEIKNILTLPKKQN